MTMQYQHQAGVLHISLSGELGHHEAIRLMGRIQVLVEDHLPVCTVLDLAGLEFMDSSGIAVVVQTARRCKDCGGRLQVRNTPPQARKVFTCAGIHRMVDMG